MGRETVHLLQDYDCAGQVVESGTFIEIDERLANELVEDAIAERKTPKQLAEKEEKRAAAKRRDETRATRDKQLADVRVVSERVEMDPSGGYGEYGFGQFCQDVAYASPKGRNQLAQRLRRWHDMCVTKSRQAKQTKTLYSGEATVEYDDSQGGYLIPQEFSNRLHNIALEAAQVRPRATFVPMGTNRIGIPAVVDEDHSSSLFGGITIYRPGEAEQKSESKPTFRQVVLTLHKLAALTNVSDEMIEDSPQSIETIITRLFGQAMVFQEESDYFNGTGVGMALGILAAPCLITQAAVPAQAANTVVAQNIIDMWARLHPSLHNGASWHCDNSVLPQLYAMGIAVGTGGSVVFTPQGGLSTSPYAMLMGRPLIATEHCQALGTLGDIYLCAWSEYAIGGKAGSSAPKVASSIHLHFDYDLVAFRFVLRYDGQPMWRVPLTPENGGNTLGPFVALATRP